MNYSSQAIIVDINKNVYLERNTKIKALSLIGGAVEESENFISALIREIKEELNLTIDEDRLLDGQEQEARIFSTGEWISKYFVLILRNDEISRVANANGIEVYKFGDLELLDMNDFSIEKDKFLSEVKRALSLLK